MTITAYICVDDARAAIEWYAGVFGAKVSYDPIVMDDGRTGHVELTIGGSKIMMSDAFPEVGVDIPEPSRGNAVTLHLHTGEVDAVTKRAIAAGARLDREPEAGPYGRTAVFHDRFGHRWLLNDQS